MAETAIAPEEFFASLAALLKLKRAALRRKGRVAFAVEAEGCYLVDLASPEIASPGWDTEADVHVLTNRRTLSDMAGGQFDPDRPEEEHLFLCSGDRSVFAEIAAALQPGRSALSVRYGVNLKGDLP